MIAIIVAAAVVILDQVSKAIVVNTLEVGESAGFIPYVIGFYHTHNTGAAFSMLKDNRWVFMVLSFIAMALIGYMLYRFRSRHILLTFSLAMILGGGIGNMIDRIRLGYVVDFLNFQFVDFAVFNIADSFITVGAVLLGVYVIFIEPKVAKKSAPPVEKGGEDDQQPTV